MSLVSNHSLSLNSSARRWFEDRLPELTQRCRLLVTRLPRREREEAQAEILAQAFRYVVQAERRGKLHCLTPFTLILFFGRCYQEGRRLTGFARRDVLTEAGRLRHGRSIRSLQLRVRPALTQRPRITVADMLTNHKAEQPLENVRRNHDYAEILDREAASAKARRVFRFFCETAGQGRQTELARELGLSTARVCQLRGELANMLQKHGYEPPATRKGTSPGRRRGRPWKNSPSVEIPLNVGTCPAKASSSRLRLTRESFPTPGMIPVPA